MYKTFEMEIQRNERIFFVQCDVKYTTSRPYLYGVDADGNQGMLIRDIEDYEIDSVYDIETGEDITEREKDAEDILSEALKAVKAYE